MTTGARYGELSLIFAISACIAAAIVPWFYLPLCEPSLMDEGYQAVCVANYRQSPLAMLIFYIGNLWTRLCGDGLLSLRQLSCLEGYIAIFIGCFYYWWRVRRVKQAFWLFTLCAVGAALDRHSIYNWDTGAFMFYTIGCVAVLEYIRKPTAVKAMTIGVTTALVFLARFQLIVLAPLLSVGFMVYGKNNIRRRVCHLCCFVAGAAVCFVIVTAAMCGSVQEYIGAFQSDNIITGHGLKDLARWCDVLKNNFSDRVIRWAVALVSIPVGWWITVSHGHRRSRFAVGVVVLVVAGWAQGCLATVRSFCQFGMEVAMGGLMLFLLLLIPAYNVTHKNRITLPLWPLGVLWIWFCVPAFGSDYWFVRYGAFYLLPLGMAVVYPAVAGHVKLRQLVVNVLCGALIGFCSALAGRFYVAVSNATYSLDEFPKLQGIYSSYDGYISWKRVQRIYELVESTGARINLDGYRYAYQYSFQKTPLSNIQLFHVEDNETNIEGRRKVIGMYDAWLFTLTLPEATEGIAAMLKENGFVMAWNGVADGGDHYQLLVREPYVEPCRAALEIALSDGDSGICAEN